MNSEVKIRYPVNFKISNSTMFITNQNNKLQNHSSHEGTLISNSNISLKCSCFYYEITTMVYYYFFISLLIYLFLILYFFVLNFLFLFLFSNSFLFRILKEDQLLLDLFLKRNLKVIH